MPTDRPSLSPAAPLDTISSPVSASGTPTRERLREHVRRALFGVFPDPVKIGPGDDRAAREGDRDAQSVVRVSPTAAIDLVY
jgi:hypothetical protein